VKILTNNTVLVLPKPNKEEQDIKVCKIRFVRQVSSGGHPAPAPLLLVVKAAINWSAHDDQPLLAGGEVHDDDIDSDSSCLSNLAEDQYLEFYDAQARLEPLPFNSISIPKMETSQL
jgi:hypothetical protein